MKAWFKFLLLIFLVIFIYRDSFTARFFQDDKILLNLPLAIVPNFPFRPISQQIFYQVCQKIFGLNPCGYHLVLFGFFLGTLGFVYHLAKRILGDKSKAMTAVFFYALNVSLFANFYWIATSYFTIGAFFFFACLLFYLKGKFWLALATYLLALGSNEIALVLPGVLVGMRVMGPPAGEARDVGEMGKRKLWFFLGSWPVILIGRAMIGLPKAADYVLDFNFLPAFRWYILRALNLPEGVDSAGTIFYFLFFIFCLVLVISLVKNFNWRVLVFGLIFFVLGAFPFFFLPDHMSSYYLTMALFGPAIIYGQVFTDKKVLFLAGLVYLALTIYGLEFLSQTHWIILKNTGPIGQF